jgi:hypothetical protein
MATSFLVPKNNAIGYLNAAISKTATTIVLQSGNGANFPSSYPFHISIDDEIITVSNRSDDTLTVTRGAESTTEAAHTINTKVVLRVTAKAISDLNTAVNTLEGYCPSAAVLEADFNAHTILYATTDDTPAALTVGEQKLVGRLTGGNISAVSIGVADNNIVQVDGTIAINDYAKWTAAGLSGRSYSEVLGDLSGQASANFSMNSKKITSLAAGSTNGDSVRYEQVVLKTLTTTKGDIIYASAANTPARLGIGTDNYILAVNSDVPAWKSPADILADLSGQAGAAFSFNSQNLTSVGTVNTHTIPSGTDTFCLIAATQELTNKTLNASVAKGTWTASGTWTIPTVTLGGNVTIGNITMLPSADNQGSLGSDSYRLQLVRAAQVTSGDYVFDNLWYMDEDKDFLYFGDQRTRNRIAKLDRDGNFYIKGEVRKWD